MARVAQRFIVRVSERVDFAGMTANDFDAVRMTALAKAKMTPHRKYFGRIRRVQLTKDGGLREWRFTIIRP